MKVSKEKLTYVMSWVQVIMALVNLGVTLTNNEADAFSKVVGVALLVVGLVWWNFSTTWQEEAKKRSNAAKQLLKADGLLGQEQKNMAAELVEWDKFMTDFKFRGDLMMTIMLFPVTLSMVKFNS
jgi:hypothetical protein